MFDFRRLANNILTIQWIHTSQSFPFLTDHLLIEFESTNFFVLPILSFHLS